MGNSNILSSYRRKNVDAYIINLNKQHQEALNAKDAEIDALVAQRTQARKDKNWAEADRIRDELKAMGIVLEDTAQGVKWHRE